MKYTQTYNHYIFVFQKGEQLIHALTEFCREQDLVAGFFYGLGGALSAEIGYYHLDKQEYEFRHLDQILEIASVQGNIALKDGEPFIHAHAVLSDAGLRSYSGHVKELVVGGTCEVHLQTFDRTWHRRYDKETGLALIDFDE